MSLTEMQALRLNNRPEWGYKYEEVKEDKPDREELLNEAERMGLDFPKNIKTDKLIELIKENKA